MGSVGPLGHLARREGHTPCAGPCTTVRPVASQRLCQKAPTPLPDEKPDTRKALAVPIRPIGKRLSAHHPPSGSRKKKTRGQTGCVILQRGSPPPFIHSPGDPQKSQGLWINVSNQPAKPDPGYIHNAAVTPPCTKQTTGRHICNDKTANMSLPGENDQTFQENANAQASPIGSMSLPGPVRSCPGQTGRRMSAPQMRPPIISQGRDRTTPVKTCTTAPLGTLPPNGASARPTGAIG